MKRKRKGKRKKNFLKKKIKNTDYQKIFIAKFFYRKSDLAFSGNPTSSAFQTMPSEKHFSQKHVLFMSRIR